MVHQSKSKSILGCIPNDVSRCNDDTCDERETCMRWICKDKGVGPWIVHTKTLRTPGKVCGKRIPIEEYEITDK